jgi:enoyl-CoA hydratase/carnithine racemase
VNDISPQIVSESESKAVEFTIQNSIAVIRLNRPKERNPLSVAVLNELDVFFSALDENLKAVIFIGSEDVFASGANLREISQLKNEREIREFGLRGQNLMNKIAAAPCLTIAAVNGYCFGGAFDLALACKIRIAAPNAMFSHPGANLGIITGWSGTQRLPRIVGEAAALETFLTAKRITAAEALKINLVSQISDDVLKSAQQIALSQTASD